MTPPESAGLAGLRGTLRSAGGDRPFLLEGDCAWVVRSGRVDVFTVPLEDGEPAGSRSHFFRAESGRLLLGLAGGEGPRFGLLAVGAAGTEVEQVSAGGLRALAADPEHAPGLASRLEEWVASLCGAVSRGVPPEGCTELEPGKHDLHGAAEAVRPRERVSWVRHEAGSSLFMGRAGLKVNGTGFTPLARSAWLETAQGSRVHVATTASLVDGGEAWAGLARLHDLVLRCAAEEAGRSAAAERERLHRKGAAERAVYRGAWSRLASTLEPGGRLRTPPPVDAPGEDLLLAAARRVGEALEIRVRPASPAEGRTAMRDPLGRIARASRFRTRRVMLRGAWWKEDGGALLAYAGEERRPVALLPVPGPGYLLHDPSTGSERRVTGELAVTLQPAAHAFYRPFGDRALGIAELVRFGLQGARRDLATVAAMNVLAGLLGLVVPVATGILFNDVIPGADRPQLVQLTLVLLVIAAATAMFRVTSSIALLRIEGRMAGATQAALWDRLLGLPLPFFRPYTAGDLAMRAMGIEAIRQVLSGATVTALIGGVMSLLHLALLFWYSERLAWWAALLIAVAVAVGVAAGRMQMRQHRDIVLRQTRIAGMVLQFLTSVAKLRVAGAEVQAFAMWAERFSEQRRLQFRAQAVANYQAAFNASFPVAAYLVIYAVAAPMLQSGTTLRTGDFLAFVASFGTCLAGMLAATAALMGTLQVVPLYEHAEPILATPPEVDTAKTDPGTLIGDVEIQRLGFRYGKDGPAVLRDVSLRIRPGEFAAFVGPSGSGKSTLLRLLLGFESPETGAVYFDGQDLADLDVQAVRSQIGVVLQSGRLMSGDLFTNIVGSSSATLEDAWEAARMAGFDEDVRAMPMGMHTVVSEGGGTLSGGQRQRLMIARAIVQKPRILFFDEATSALDNRTQAVVSASLERLQATRIVIAHRLSTIVSADRIFVVEGGRIVQSGTYDELIREEGLFAELARRQLA